MPRQINKTAFVLPKDRSSVTREPEIKSSWTPLFPEMTGFANQGPAKLSPEFTWPTNPKQWQEELTDAKLRRRNPGEVALLPEPNPKLKLPSGDPVL